MPLWSPPTPPQDDNDVYIDFSLLFLYEPDIMSEASLPPIVRRDKKRLRQEVNSDGQPLSKIRHRDDVPPAVPRSLFDRPSPALLKLRHEVRLAKYRSGGIGSGRSASLPSSALAAGAALKAPGGAVGSKPPATPEPDPGPEWLIHEDMALLQAVHSLEIHPNLIVLAPGHTPNWDLVAELVNQVSRVYRSARSCQNRYENVLIAREEGKLMYDPSPKKHKTKNKLQIFTKIPQLKSGRSMRTAQLYAQDNNLTLTSLLVARYEAMHAIIDRRTPTTQSFKPLLVNSATNQNLWTHAEVLNSSQILYDQPLSPVEVAQKLAERIAKEKQANAASRGTTEQQQAAQLLIQQRRAAAAAQVAETAQQQAAAVAQQQQALAAQQQQALAAAQQQQQALAAAQQQQVLVAAQQQTATTASQSQQQVAAVQQIIQAQQAAQAGQQLTVQTQHGTLVQQQTVRQVATPVRTLQQQRTVNVSELVRSVQSVVAASSQQVATGQQIRTSAVTTAVVMSSSTQPIVTTRMITGSPAGTTTKPLTPSQLQLYKQQQLRQQQLRLLQQGRSPAGTTTKPLTPSQLQLYKQQQLRQQQLRLLQQKAVAAAQVQQVVSSGGSVIQQTSSPVTIRAQAKPRTVTDAEMAILKRQMLQQAAAQQQSATQKAAVGSLLAQTSGAIQPGTQVTTLVKTLPPQTAGIIPQVKTLSAAQIKPTAAQFRQIQFQQQLIAQRKASSAAPTGGTTTAKVVKAAGVGGTTQLIVAGGGKSLTGTMTMQQIQQVIKQQIPHAGTINVSTSSGQVISHAVITKSPQVQQRTVIPVATSVSVAGAKQTIQVVTATPSSGGVARPTAQTIKVATGATSSSVSQQQQALLSQVTAAIQQGTMRPSPVRIQSASGQPIVAVAVSQSQQQATQQHHVIHHQSNPDQATQQHHVIHHQSNPDQT
ncbi:hypothetical protein M8J77_005126 [Diaphorina citri]|nr:hypothetical protein M8J77_005126 [Diaphorina citri]